MDRIIPMITDPYYSNSSWFRAMYQEIVNTALAQKDQIVLYDSGLSSADIDRLPPVVLLASGVKEYIQQTISILKAHHKSVILAGLMDDAVDTEVSSVSPATQYEVQLVLNYLHACGRHKIALVGFREHGMNDLIRYREMIEYAEKTAYPITRENIFFRGNSIDKAIHRFYNDIEHYDAAVCPNGAAAIYLINYCTRNGIVVPEDLFVISFSDMHMASYSNPSLTCVGSDFASIGKKVVFLWNFLNEHSEDQLIMNIKVVSNLVIRESTANIPYDSNPGSEAESGISPYIDKHYESRVTNSLFCLESELQGCDHIDYYIIRMIIKGISYEQMTEETFMSISGIRYRVKRLFNKLGVHSRSELIKKVVPLWGDC